VAGCCECGDGPSGSCATELVSLFVSLKNSVTISYISYDYVKCMFCNNNGVINYHKLFKFFHSIPAFLLRSVKSNGKLALNSLNCKLI
jgi:hypothetical protein